MWLGVLWLFLPFAVLVFINIWLEFDEQKRQRVIDEANRGRKDNLYKDSFLLKYNLPFNSKHQILMEQPKNEDKKAAAFTPFNDFFNEDKFRFYIQHENEILYSFYEDYKKYLRSLKTTGESKIYKDKLKDERWIKLSESIKKRDHYRCQHCFNILKLDNINDIYKIVDFEEVANNVIDIYNQLMRGEIEFETYQMLSVENYATYIKKHNIWLMLMIERGRNILEDAYLNEYRVSYSVISGTKYDSNNEYVYCLKNTLPMRYKAKNGVILHTNKILIERNMNIITSNDLFLYHRIDYCNKSFCDFTGRATLFFNWYAITFPLYNFKFIEPLNVHHKQYAENGNPWDVDEKHLITLCKSCHILEHQNTNNG